LFFISDDNQKKKNKLFSQFATVGQP